MTSPLVFDLRYATARYPGVGSYAVGLAEALLAVRPEWPWRVLMPDGESRFDLSFVPEAARARGAGDGGARKRGAIDPSAPAPGPAQGRLGRLLRDLGASLYHSPYFLRPWGARCPSILTVHDVIPLEHHAGMSGPRRAIYRWLVGDALGAACVVTDSETSRDAIRAAFKNARRPAPSRDREFSAARRGEPRRPPADPLVIYPGCRIAESSEAWTPWSRPVLLTVGINKPHKNLEVLMRALALLPAGRRPLLACAGPVDPRFPDPITLAGWHSVTGDVGSLGMVPEDRLAALYRSATLFAFPTRIEGFGLPLLEAMTLGVPAIASDLLVLREIAGDAAWRVAPDDAPGWAAAISTLLGDPTRRAAMAERGLARARRFSYAEAARQLTLEYEALVPELARRSEAARSGGAAQPTGRAAEARP